MSLEPKRLDALLELSREESSIEEVEPNGGANWVAAMHRVVDFQDELGLLAEELFRVLRRARSDGVSPAIEGLPNAEVHAFEAVLNDGASERAISRSISICDGLPGLDAVLEMLRKRARQVGR